MLKKILITAALLISIPAFASQVTYSSVIEDLPMMPGMSEQSDPVVFEKPGGRIVATTAKVAATPDAAENFYAQALPPLGWYSDAPAQYIRDGEILKLEFEKADGITIVHFNITPKG